MLSFARRLTALAIVAGASCNVYSPSLLTGSGGSGTGAAGGTGGTSGSGSGTGGDGGMAPVAGKGGSGGGAGSGGAAGSGGSAGGTAGTSNGGRSQGGAGGAGGNGGSGGSGDMGGDGGAMGGEAGMDPGVGGTAGAGGSAGSMAGTAGGGMGGTAGGGMGGTAGGGTAGMGGSGVTGCAKLTVPLDANADVARFVISLPNNTDFNSATISATVYVESGAAGSIFLYVQDGSGNFRFLSQATGSRPQLKNLVGKWTTFTWNVGTEPIGGSQISKAIIKRIGVEVAATPDSSGWSPSTVVYVDSISVNTPALSFPFATTYTVSTATNLTGDQGTTAIWLNSNSSDTTAMPLTAPSWVDTCP